MAKSKLEIAYLSVNQLDPYEKNTRTHDVDQVAEIVDSIKEFGFTNPVLIDENNEIIAGHGRLAAARKLRMKEVPTILLAGLTDAQKRTYRIADNKLALNAGWDYDLLREEIRRIHNEDEIDATLTGFKDMWLEQFLVDEESIVDKVQAEWPDAGMPSYNGDKAEIHRSIIVHFNSDEDVDEFAKRLGLEFTSAAKTIWFPEAPETLHVRAGNENVQEWVHDG